MKQQTFPDFNMLNFIEYAIQFTHHYYWEDEYDIRKNKYQSEYYGENYNVDDIMQTEKISATQRAHNVLNFTIPNTTIHSILEEFTVYAKIINESMTRNMSNMLCQRENCMLYLYGTPALIFFCIISILVNINVIISVFWIKRPLSPTLCISLSLAGNDISLSQKNFLNYYTRCLTFSNTKYIQKTLL